MKRYVLAALCLVFCAVFVSAQSGTPTDSGSTLTVGKNGSLGLETSTTFAWDANDNSTGLETKAGIELIIDLFPYADRGVQAENTDTPTVRLALKNAAFSWWNTFQTTGGNYEQDNFNSWTARPLLLTFDSLISDVVWKNYFFRVAGTTTVMRTNLISLRSIFDDVMDAQDRFYVARNQALWVPARYNIQQLPLLKGKLDRDMVDTDYRAADKVSGILAGGAEFDKFGFTLKTASKARGKDNNDNAWLIGADAEFAPSENLKFEATGFAAVNYDTAGAENPYTFGVAAEYRVPLSGKLILTPFVGYDFEYEKTLDTTQWEAGAGIVLYTQGYDTRASSRVLDYADVIPVGASLALNVNEDSLVNLELSWFDPAGEDSLLPNFGGFMQFEMANVLGNKGEDPDFAILGQFEYALRGKFFPYIRGGYKPEITGTTTRTGAFIITSALGCYIKPFNNFSVDVRYERQDLKNGSDMELDQGLFSATFTISL
jgi:opacity protein-like surface antigen